MSRYPNNPGSKVAGTSEDAAQQITKHAKTVRDRVRTFFEDHHPAGYTADQVAAALSVNILTVRSRVAELRRSGVIEPTDERRLNASGMFAICWRAKVRNIMEAAQ